MDETLHDIRNDLAIALGCVHALRDGKLEFHDTLEIISRALTDIDAALDTWRVKAQASGVARSESLFTSIVEAAPNAMILVGERGNMVLVNAQAEKLFGYTRDELLALSIDKLVPQRFRRGHPAMREGFNASPTARPMGAGRDLYGLRKDGTEIPVEIALNPVRTDKGTFVLAAIVDITERKRAEELRLLHAGVQKHAAELEELNRELASASRFKTQFVSTMSHELRTPLTAIIGAAELLSRAKLDPRDRTNVETITEAGQMLLTLINSILDFSKIEAGKMELQPAPFDAAMIVEGAAEVVAQMAREKGLTLHTYVDPDIPPVYGDGDRLRQILLNLLGNAIKFTEAGRIVVRATLVSAGADEVVLRFEVQDTGVGIRPEALPSVFEPFSQGRGQGSHMLGGTGLGLSISKRLVDLMNGEIGVQSEVGKGSLFWFTARFGPIAERVRPMSALEGVRVLILSSDDVFAEIVERYVSGWGMDASRAVDRADVLRALEARSTPWVAIVDLDNVGVAGIDVTLDVLRAIVPSRIITVGKGGELHKPLRQSHLSDAVAKAIVSGDGERAGPRHAQPGAGDAAAAPDTALKINGTVLVAEDSLPLQRLLKMQFEELAVPATFVSDGAQALEALRNGHYAMIFMDSQMPNMDGLTAARLIREQEKSTGGHIPIAAMTADVFAENRELTKAAGMDDFLAKPIKLADLRAVLERCLGSSAP